MRYAIITGTGRSGTNWLLDICDASPQVHGRNEPHGIPGTALQQFPLTWTSDQAGDADFYRKTWDAVALGASRRFGQRDHNILYPKPYLHSWSNHLGVKRALTGPRARRLASMVDRRLRAPEWELPLWLGSQRRLEESLGVLKILIDAPLLAWLLSERPQVPVIHIIRHPGGRLNSWLTRLVEPMSSEQRVALHAGRVHRIERIRAADPRWHDLMPEPSSLTLTRLELWFWRYVNETSMEAGHGHPSYRLVRFDDLARDPLTQAMALYEHLGLTWGAEISKRIAADSSRSVFGAVSDSRGVADMWKSELDSESHQAIDDIVSDSPLHDLLG